jgi:transcription factor SPN1
MIQEMEAAYLADLENNQMGKPALNKLQTLTKIMYRIKAPLFAEIFLDKNGLEQFHNFLKRLPDGSWPLSSIRKTILESVYNLPIQIHHLKYTKLGKTITAIQESKNETPENKKLAQNVKDKWSRIVTGNPMEYSNLEQYEVCPNFAHKS